MDELSEWLAGSYAPAYRTACLILHNRADAEEAVQDAFLRAWRFRASLPPGEAARPWLYRVVVNACLSKLRADKATRDNRADDAVLQSLPSSAPDPLAAAEQADEANAVLAAVKSLPETLRVPVVLRYYSGLSEREIATAIRRRPGTVKSRLHEARNRLAADPALQALVVPEEELAP